MIETLGSPYPIVVTKEVDEFRRSAWSNALKDTLERKEVHEGLKALASCGRPSTLPPMLKGEAPQEAVARQFHFLAGINAAIGLLHILAKHKDKDKEGVIGVDELDYLESQIPEEFRKTNQPKP